MSGSGRRNVLLTVLFLLALPGYALMLHDVIRSSPEEIVDRIEPWREHVAAAARMFDLDEALITAVIAVESKGEPEARSGRGALGLMQLMPGTAREMARLLDEDEPEDDDLFEPAINIRLGARYLSLQMDVYQDISLALAAYNAGPRRVQEWIEDSPVEWTTEEILRERAYSETRSYVTRVRNYRNLVARMRRGED